MASINPGLGVRAPLQICLIVWSDTSIPSLTSKAPPHITPACAYVQVKRVAQARGMNEAEVKAIVDKNISKPFLGVFGTETVNVLELNIALEEADQNK